MESRLYMDRAQERARIAATLNALSAFYGAFNGTAADNARALFEAIKDEAEAIGLVVSAMDSNGNGTNSYRCFEADGAAGKRVLAYRRSVMEGAHSDN